MFVCVNVSAVLFTSRPIIITRLYAIEITEPYRRVTSPIQRPPHNWCEFS